MPPDGNWWFDLEDVVEAYPAQIAEVVTHLLDGSDEPIHDAYQLGQLVERLKPLLPADALRPLVEAALRRNIAGAAGWFPWTRKLHRSGCQCALCWLCQWSMY